MSSDKRIEIGLNLDALEAGLKRLTKVMDKASQDHVGRYSEAFNRLQASITSLDTAQKTQLSKSLSKLDADATKLYSTFKRIDSIYGFKGQIESSKILLNQLKMVQDQLNKKTAPKGSIGMENIEASRKVLDKMVMSVEKYTRSKQVASVWDEAHKENIQRTSAALRKEQEAIAEVEARYIKAHNAASLYNKELNDKATKKAEKETWELYEALRKVEKQYNDDFIAATRFNNELDQQKAKTISGIEGIGAVNVSNMGDTRLRAHAASIRALERELNKLSKTGRITKSEFLRLADSLDKAKKKYTEFGNRMQNTTGIIDQWWQKFGRVAIGFTLAYRAMNVFEEGMRKAVETLKDSVILSGQLVGIQGELATYYNIATKAAMPFSETFKRASVNVGALTKASLLSVSSLNDLSVAMSEVAQHGIIVQPEQMADFTAVNDLLILVSKSTGDTAKQIRSEWQGLLDGQLKATNAMVRMLKQMGIISDAELKTLKGVGDKSAVFEKVLKSLSKEAKDLQDILLGGDVEKGLDKWQASLTTGLAAAIKKASDQSGVANIFGDVFLKHIKSLNERLFADEQQEKFIDGMILLARATDKVLGAMEEVVIKMVELLSVTKVYLPTIKLAVATLASLGTANMLSKITSLTLGWKSLTASITAAGIALVAFLDKQVDKSVLKDQIKDLDETLHGLVLSRGKLTSAMSKMAKKHPITGEMNPEFVQAQKNLSMIDKIITTAETNLAFKRNQLNEKSHESFLKTIKDTIDTALDFYGLLDKETEKAAKDVTDALGKITVETSGADAFEDFMDLIKSSTKFYDDFVESVKAGGREFQDLAELEITVQLEEAKNRLDAIKEGFDAIVKSGRELSTLEVGNILLAQFEQEEKIKELNEKLGNVFDPTRIKRDLKEIEDLWENTRNAMQDSISGFLGDTVKGEFSSFKDYFKGFTDSLIDVWASAMSQMIMEDAFSAFAMEASSPAGSVMGGLSAGLDAINPWMLGAGVVASVGSGLGGWLGGDSEIDLLIEEMRSLRESIDENTLNLKAELRATSPSGAEIEKTMISFRNTLLDITDNIKLLQYGTSDYTSLSSIPGVGEMSSNDILGILESLRGGDVWGSEDQFRSVDNIPGLPDDYFYTNQTLSNRGADEVSLTEEALDTASSLLEETATKLSLLTLNTSDALRTGLEGLIDSLTEVDLANKLDIFDFAERSTAFGAAIQDFKDTFGEWGEIVDENGNKTEGWISGLRKDMTTQIEQQKSFREMMDLLDPASEAWNDLNDALITEDELSTLKAGFDAIDDAEKAIIENFAELRKQTSEAMASDKAQYAHYNEGGDTIDEGFLSGVQRAIAEVEEQGKSYYEQLVDNGMVTSLAADKTALWTKEVSDLVQAQMVGNTTRSLTIELLKAQGKTEEAVALEHEGIINDLRDTFGDLAGPIIDLQKEIWRLDDVADDAVVAISGVANAMSNLDIASQVASIAGLSEKFKFDQIALDLGWASSGKFGSKSQITDLVNSVIGGSPQQIREMAESFGLTTDVFLDDIDYLNQGLTALAEVTNDVSDAADTAADALQDQADAIKDMIASVESLQDLIENIKGAGEYAPVQSMEYFELRYQQLLAEAQSGGSREVEVLTDFTQKYLDFAQQYGGDYGAVADNVLGDLQALEDSIAGDKTLADLYAQLERTNAELSAVRSNTGATAAGIADAIGKTLENLFDEEVTAPWEGMLWNFGTLLDKFREGAEKASQYIGKEDEWDWGKGWLGGSSDIDISQTASGAYRAAFTGSSGQNIATIVYRDMMDIGMEEVWKLMSASPEIWQSWQNAFAPGGTHYGGYATGTDYSEGGLAWAGEEGRELIDFPEGTRVRSNEDTLNDITEAVKIALNDSGTGGNIILHAKVIVGTKEFKDVTAEVVRTSSEVQRQVRRVANGR